MKIVFGDLYRLISNEDISIQMNEDVIRDIADYLGYDCESFLTQIEEDYGYSIEPDDFVDLVGLSAFLDDAGAPDSFFNKFEVFEIVIVESETGKSIGLIM